MSGALAYQPDGSQAALMFQIKKDSYNTESLIGFLHDLHEHFGGANVTLIWDNLPSHKSKAMKAWLATQASWLQAERLPGYAHDAQPNRAGLGQRQSRRAGQPVPGHHRRGTRRRRGRPEAGQQQLAQLCFAFLARHGSFSMSLVHSITERSFKRLRGTTSLSPRTGQTKGTTELSPGGTQGVALG